MEFILTHRRNGFYSGSRTAGIASHHRGSIVAERLSSQSSVRGRAADHTVRYVYSLRMYVKGEPAASRVRPGLYVIRDKVHHFLINAVYVRIVVAEFRRFVQKQLTHSFFALKVLVNGSNQLIHGDVFVFKYALLNGDNGVSQVCSASNVHARRGVFRAAVLYGLTAFYAAFGHHARENHRESGHMHALHHFVTGCDQLIVV